MFTSLCVLGVEKTIKYKSKVECPTCLGTGAALGTTAQPCVPCKKQGFVPRPCLPSLSFLE